MKRHHVPYWKPIVQLGISQPACPNQRNLSQQHHCKSPRLVSKRVRPELSDTAVESTPPFKFDDEDTGDSIAKFFLFFLYGTISGSVWTLFLIWLFH